MGAFALPIALRSRSLSGVIRQDIAAGANETNPRTPIPFSADIIV
jgi:hypothetical protein